MKKSTFDFRLVALLLTTASLFGGLVGCGHERDDGSVSSPSVDEVVPVEAADSLESSQPQPQPQPQPQISHGEADRMLLQLLLRSETGSGLEPGSISPRFALEAAEEPPVALEE
jgi:hypothetical protein